MTLPAADYVARSRHAHLYTYYDFINYFGYKKIDLINFILFYYSNAIYLCGYLYRWIMCTCILLHYLHARDVKA